MDIVDVTPPSAPIHEAVSDRAQPVAGDPVGALLWLLAAAVLIFSCWLPMTNELEQFPAENGVPAGFVRVSADAWGRLRATHSAFEGPVLGNGAPRYGTWFAICAVALIVAGLGQRWPRIVPAGRPIGGIALLLTGGAILAIRFEKLPRQPIEADPGTSLQFGGALWLMTIALILGALALSRAYVRGRRVALSVVPKPPSRWRTPEAVLGSLLSAALAVGAGVARAFDVATAEVANGRIAHVSYRFDGWGHGVTRPGGPVGPVDPLDHFGLFAAQDEVLVLLSCAVLLVAAVLGVSRRVGATDLLRIGVGTVLIGVVAIQVAATDWTRGYFTTSDKIGFTTGSSVWMLLVAAAVALVPCAWRVWERRTQQARAVDLPDPGGLDLLSGHDLFDLRRAMTRRRSNKPQRPGGDRPLLACGPRRGLR